MPVADTSDAKKQPLAERVHAHLRDEILHGRLQPGQVILEAELAAQFGVSKTPVREALRLLVQDGWVIVLPRKGYLVRPLGIDDLREVFLLREALEPGFAAEAAWRASGPAARDLHDAVATQRASQNDLDAALSSAAAFHIRIAELAGHVRGARIIATLVDEVTRLHFLMPALESHIESTEELDAHQAIADAIEAGQQRDAQRLMLQHLKTTDRALGDVFGVPRRHIRA
jgi:DNA-binding GntR family transcriptional regulator